MIFFSPRFIPNVSEVKFFSAVISLNKLFCDTKKFIILTIVQSSILSSSTVNISLQSRKRPKKWANKSPKFSYMSLKKS